MSQFSIWKDCICPQGTVTVLTSMNKMPYILEILICDQNPPHQGSHTINFCILIKCQECLHSLPSLKPFKFTACLEVSLPNGSLQ